MTQEVGDPKTRKKLPNWKTAKMSQLEQVGGHQNPSGSMYFLNNGSLGSFDPWVVPFPEELNSYGARMLLTMVGITSSVILSAPIDIGQTLHPHM
jgi:hypothetical protein